MRSLFKKIRACDIPVLIATAIQLLLIFVNLIYPTDAVNYTMYIMNYAVGFTAILSLALRNVAVNFLPMTFLGCFMLFLMGQKPFKPEYNVFLTFIRTELNTEQYFLFATIRFAGLAGSYYAYLFFVKQDKAAKRKERIRRLELEADGGAVLCGEGLNKQVLTTIALVILILTLPMAVYMQVKIVSVKSGMGYTDSYLVNVDIPTVIKIGYFLFISVMLVFLALKPKKGYMFAALAVYVLLEGGLQLMQGRRALFAATLLFAIWYLLKYYRVTKIKMRTLLVIAAVAVGMVVVFILVEQMRNGAENQVSLGTLARFLISTGGSDSVIANTIVRKGDFPEHGIVYLFDPLINNFAGNLLLGKAGVPQGMDYLAQHNSFAHWISYLSQKSLYLSGHGMGSSFLAEAYVAFGLLGVLLSVVAVGWVLCKAGRIQLGVNPVTGAMALFMVRQLFTLPRDSMFGWFGDMIYLIAAFVLIGGVYVVWAYRREQRITDRNRRKVQRLEKAACETVTVGIIAYNEEKYLPQLLENVLQQTYPKKLTQIILVDGNSSDQTKAVMEQFQAQHEEDYRSILVIDNPKKIQPAGWNLVIREATEDVILRIDAHAIIPEDFVEKNMACICSGEDVCGGPRENVIDEHTSWKKMLLDAEQSLFGSGFASYRRGTQERKYVKSVFHGAYRREVFQKAGVFNEALVRTEDNEMHYRIRRNGYRICYDPGIQSYYQTRNTLPKMLKQKYQNGFWIGRTLKVCPGCISVFHLVPAAFVCALGVSLVLALLGVWWILTAVMAAYFAFLIVNTVGCLLKTRNWMDLLLPAVYFLMHVVYGVGTLRGFLKGGKL